MRIIKISVVLSLVAAMSVTMLPQGITPTAKKKVSLNKTGINTKVGAVVSLSLKNVSKKAKVTWKTTDKKIAKIIKKTAKGNTSSAKIRCIAPGKVTITASYKHKKKTKKYNCVIKIKKATGPLSGTSDRIATAAPGQNASQSSAVVVNQPSVTVPVTSGDTANGNQGSVPQTVPSVSPTENPVPSAEPTPLPVKTLDLMKDDLVEIPLRDEFRKTGTDGQYLKDNAGNYIPLDEYSSMNSKAKYENGIVYCESANNIIFNLPSDHYIKTGDKIDVEISGTYDPSKDSDKGFRVFLVDTEGKDASANVSSGDPITTSDIMVLTKTGGDNKESLKLNDKNEFTIKKTFVAGVNEGDAEKAARSGGITTAITVKASTWNGMFGDLTITGVKVTVRS